LTFNFTGLTLGLNIFAVVVILVMAAMVWARRPTPGTMPLTLLMLAVIVWIFIHSFEVAAVNFETKIFLGKLIYFLTVTIAILWLFFALDFTGSRGWRNPRNLILLGLIPLATAMILIINRPAVLEWLQILPVETSTTIIVWQKGPFVWLQTVYVAALLLAGAVLLGRYALRSQANQRWKLIAILIATFMPIISHAIDTTGIFAGKAWDITPLTMAIAGAIYAMMILRFRFLDIIPVARGALVESIPEGILVLDSEGCIADMNPAAERMIGAKLTSVLGKKADRVSPWLGNIAGEGQNDRPGELCSAAASAGLYLEISVTPLKKNLSSVTGQLIVLNDITERKKNADALQASEEKYRSLVNNIVLGVFRSTPAGRHLEFNKAMETITGYSRQELLEMDVSDLYLHPQDRQVFLRKIQSGPETATNEIWNKKKDGTPILVAVTINPVRGPEGDLLFYDGILEDITERKKLEAQIQELYAKEKHDRQELEEEAKARGIFINVLGHELRTPLTPIVTSLDSLKNIFGRNPDSIEHKLISNVFDSSQVLVQRLDELLELGKFSRGEAILKFQPFNMNDLVESIAARLQPLIKAKDQNLILEITGSLPHLEADPSLIEQVLFNLLSNASRFSPEHGKVILRIERVNEGLQVEVQDNGSGISAEEQKRLFQPYHRIEQDRSRFPGLGLGLAISRQIIEAHQGKIWVNSQPDQGSIFSFTLPVKS
jgi:PAS domain S-box-containing protein